MANDDSFSTGFGQTLTVAAGAGLLVNDSDPDGDAITVVSIGSAENGSINAFADGSFTYIPDAGFSGTETIAYTISDGFETAAATLTIEVTASGNTRPNANTDTYSVDEDAVLIVAAAAGVLANDSDPDGDSLTAVLLTGPLNGSLVLNVDGSFTYAPNADFNGADSFTYEVSDGNGGTDAATVNLNVNGVNDDPEAKDDNGLTTPFGTELTIDPVTLLANDTDVDGDTLSLTAVGNAIGGTVAIVGGQVVFTPTSGFSGAASFTYDITDGNGGSDSATVSLTVAPAATGTDDTFIGSRANDVFDGGAGNDTFLLRFGDDTATGGTGMDRFLIDARYVNPGDTQTITDLNFGEGDWVEFRFFPGLRDIRSAADLQFYVDNGFAVVAPASGGALNVTFQNLNTYGLTAGFTFVGGRSSDVFNGGNGDDRFLIRFGDDTVTGGAGADEFIFDGRYVGTGSNHHVTDLNFDQGDFLTLRFFQTGTLRIDSEADLLALDSRDWAEVLTTTEGFEVTVTNPSGESMTITLDLDNGLLVI